jgi:hypothetical protein
MKSKSVLTILMALAPDGGAATAAGNETFHLNDASDDTSLSLPAGSSVGSPPVCMSIGTPSFWVTARNSGDPTSRLRVTASYSRGIWQIDDLHIDPFARR